MRASFEKYFPEEQNTTMKLNSWIHNPFLPNLPKSDEWATITSPKNLVGKIEEFEDAKKKKTIGGKFKLVDHKLRTADKTNRQLEGKKQQPVAEVEIECDLGTE
ncbi:hypothetical protein TNCV_2253651 [Trichonephila clavipes]|nr:hypothetical protein TNCV_2253651 [Trichonephila clavipes]